MVKDKVSFSLTPQEFHAIESISYRYLFADKFFPYVPDFKELIQAFSYLTLVKISANNNSLRSFINSILSKRKFTLIEPGELPEEEEEQIVLKEFIPNEITVKETPSSKTRTRSYIFKVEVEDRKIIDQIKKLVEKYTKIQIDNLKDSEIIKESINFVIWHKWRNIEFFHYTYISSLYDLKPITILKMVNSRDEIPFSEEEIESLSAIEQDIVVQRKFINKLKKADFPDTVSSVYEFVHGGLRSEFAGFNYAEAFLGYWLASDFLPYNTTVYSFSVMTSIIEMFDNRDKEEAKKGWERSKDLFILLLENTMEAVIQGNSS